MVFTRHGLIYEKADPAVQTPNQKENPQSLSLSRSRLRRNKNGKYVTPPNSWIARIGTDYHVLPRTKIGAPPPIANGGSLLNAEIFNVGDPLVLHQPQALFSSSTVTPASVVEITIGNVTDTYTVDGTTGVTIQAEIVDFINNSPILSQKIYAVGALSPVVPIFHIFGKDMVEYPFTLVGVTSPDTQLIGRRPIGTIATVGDSDDPDNYNDVTVVPSTDPNAIALNILPLGAVVDSPVYHELMGLFDASRNMENAEQLNIAPVKGSIGVFIPFLSHYDETLKLDFPKINFTNS